MFPHALQSKLLDTPRQSSFKGKLKQIPDHQETVKRTTPLPLLWRHLFGQNKVIQVTPMAGKAKDLQ
jgi:hypothetical protein